jgi:hypothetical protein
VTWWSLRLAGKKSRIAEHAAKDSGSRRVSQRIPVLAVRSPVRRADPVGPSCGGNVDQG